MMDPVVIMQYVLYIFLCMSFGTFLACLFSPTNLQTERSRDRIIKKQKSSLCVGQGLSQSREILLFLWTRIQIEFSPLGLQREDKGKVLFMHDAGVPQRERKRGGSRWVAGLWAEESCCLSLWFVKHNRGRRGANGKIPHQWSEEVYMGVCVKVCVCVRVYELCQISLQQWKLLCLWMVLDSLALQALPDNWLSVPKKAVSMEPFKLFKVRVLI